MSNGLENIEHVIVLMFENRSFDNVLGWLYDSQNAPPFNQVPAGQSFEGLNPIPPSNGFTYDGISYAYLPRHGTDMTQPNPDPNEIYQHVYMQMFNPPAMPPQIPDPPTTEPGAGQAGKDHDDEEPSHRRHAERSRGIGAGGRRDGRSCRRRLTPRFLDYSRNDGRFRRTSSSSRTSSASRSSGRRTTSIRRRSTRSTARRTCCGASNCSPTSSTR